jgi:outer membrane putative beta-barrel porin/alpha-amylase
MRRALLMLCLAVASAAARAQAPPAEQEAPGGRGPIQDNSFLIEEAYNQEPGVVQHINLFQRNWRTGEWLATFTQEYPVPGIRHQLSYTIPAQRIDFSQGTATGLGDVALNYRYQLVGDGQSRVAVAPRLTILLPTGDVHRALGGGSTGLQVSLPVSTVLSDSWVAHWNAGATFIPAARNGQDQKADTLGYDFAASLIWLGRPNVMLETFWARSESVVAPGRTRGSTLFLVSPGIRWSYDFPSGLEIVPGIAIPIGVGPSHGQRSILLYLSFELPFWKVAGAKGKGL